MNRSALLGNRWEFPIIPRSLIRRAVTQLGRDDDAGTDLGFAHAANMSRDLHPRGGAPDRKPCSCRAGSASQFDGLWSSIIHQREVVLDHRQGRQQIQQRLRGCRLDDQSRAVFPDDRMLTMNVASASGDARCQRQAAADAQGRPTRWRLRRHCQPDASWGKRNPGVPHHSNAFNARHCAARR